MIKNGMKEEWDKGEIRLNLTRLTKNTHKVEGFALYDADTGTRVHVINRRSLRE